MTVNYPGIFNQDYKFKYPITRLIISDQLDKLISEGRSTSGPIQQNDVEVIRYSNIQ